MLYVLSDLSQLLQCKIKSAPAHNPLKQFIMITSANKIKQENFGNITDYSASCPEGMRSLFAYAHFTDMSYCLFSNIFAATRRIALAIARDKFADCEDYLQGITLYESDN